MVSGLYIWGGGLYYIIHIYIINIIIKWWLPPPIQARGFVDGSGNTFSYSHAYRSFGWTKKLSQRHSRREVANGTPFSEWAALFASRDSHRGVTNAEALSPGSCQWDAIFLDEPTFLPREALSPSGRQWEVIHSTCCLKKNFPRGTLAGESPMGLCLSEWTALSASRGTLVEESPMGRRI